MVLVRTILSELIIAAGNKKYLIVSISYLGFLCPSSCASRPAICNWSTYTDPAPNPHVLYGGLVGGPDRNDTYIDIRTNVAGNEVALDYNAAFQTTVAGLLQYQLKP